MKPQTRGTDTQNYQSPKHAWFFFIKIHEVFWMDVFRNALSNTVKERESKFLDPPTNPHQYEMVSSLTHTASFYQVQW